MKNMNNPTWKTGGMALMLLCSLLTSCSNEELLGEKSQLEGCNTISFGLTHDAEPNTKGCSEASSAAFTANRFVLRSDQSADTLCVRTLVSDGINVSGFEGEQTITRGTPVGNDNFYNNFHVLAYWNKNGEPVDQFYMDTNARNATASVGTGAIWSTDQIYYWPGAGHSFQFYAWAPTDASGLDTPSSPQSKSLTYAVPDAAADQKDIVVAATEEIQGDNNAAVPLQFEHICTAVRFVVGNEMQPGTIQSVALKHVANSGTYSMSNKSWTLNAAVTDFTQQLNLSTTGSEANGTEITTAEGTFMMLPQTFASDSPAEVEVVFINENQETRTLTASIASSQWPIGKTVTYRLSISPEYELEFLSEPEYQDAHYVIYPITIKADKLPEGGWTLTSNDPTNVTFVENFAHPGLQSLVDQGYWLKDYCGTSTLTSTSVGEVKIYVFLKENIDEKDRDITLSLKPAAQGNYKAQEFSFKQYCPAWNNEIGVERIQDKDYPWGFNWDSSMKITYSMPNTWNAAIIHILWGIFGDHSYVESSGAVIRRNWKVTVDFSKVPKLTQATSADDGQTNTWEIYTFDGINEASSIMAQLESWGGVPDKELPSNPQEFAAWACAMKNQFGVNSKTQQGEVVYVPVLDQADLKWYLPAQNEASSMNDNLSGDYWTSTAITEPGTTAYKYTAGGLTSAHDRNKSIHVRAVRKK